MELQLQRKMQRAENKNPIIIQGPVAETHVHLGSISLLTLLPIWDMLVLDRLFSRPPQACAMLAEPCSFFERRPTNKTKSYPVVPGAFPESSPVLVGGFRVNREPCELPLKLTNNF